VIDRFAKHFNVPSIKVRKTTSLFAMEKQLGSSLRILQLPKGTKLLKSSGSSMLVNIKGGGWEDDPVWPASDAGSCNSTTCRAGGVECNHLK
jgi:hypothetical protein